MASRRPDGRSKVAAAAPRTGSSSQARARTPASSARPRGRRQCTVCPLARLRLTAVAVGACTLTMRPASRTFSVGASIQAVEVSPGVQPAAPKALHHLSSSSAAITDACELDRARPPQPRGHGLLPPPGRSTPHRWLVATTESASARLRAAVDQEAPGGTSPLPATWDGQLDRTARVLQSRRRPSSRCRSSPGQGHLPITQAFRRVSMSTVHHPLFTNPLIISGSRSDQPCRRSSPRERAPGTGAMSLTATLFFLVSD